MTKILVPIDGSAEAKKAFEQAISIAKKYNASLTLMSVVEVESDMMFSEPGIVVSGDYVDIRDTLIQIKQENMNKVLDLLIKSADCTGVSVDKTVRIGSAHPEIIDTVCTGKYDLIVMGHRGLNPVKRFFMGSVAKRVIEDAPCSVLIVK